MRSSDDQVRWVRAWPDGDTPQFRVGRIGQELVAEWPGFASLRANRSGTRTEYRLLDTSIDPWVAEKFERGQVRALLRHLGGELTFHGSAAALDGRAVILLGDSEAGKSSTTAALCKYRSANFLADDVVPVASDGDAFSVVPMETHHWLSPDAIASLDMTGSHVGATKIPVLPTLASAEPVELALIVRLTFDGGLKRPQARRLTGGSVFEVLSTSAVRFVVDEREAALHDFQQMSELAAHVPIFDLSRPRAIEFLEPSAHLIGDLLDQRQGERRT
jgi:hypothetical protein